MPGFLAALLEPRREAPERRSQLAWFEPGYFQSQSRTGLPVTERNSISIPAYWCGQRVLGDGVASVPLGVYERVSPGVNRPAPDHPVHRLIHDNPNPFVTSYVWRETGMGHATSYGGWFSEIEFDRRGRPAALWPLDPASVRPVVRNRRWWLVVYPTSDPDVLDPPEGPERVLRADEVIHVPGFGFNGIRGYNAVQAHKQALGLAMAEQSFGASWFGNAGRPSGVLQHPRNLTDDGAKKLKEGWEARNSGPENWNRIAILEEGMEFKQITVSPEEAQFLDSRQFSVLDIARILNVRPHLLMDLSRATFSNVEQQALDHVTHTLRPWYVKIEQELNRKLFSESERRRYYVKFNAEGLLRGDIATRYNAYAIARQWGWLSADEIREIEDMNPLPDGHGRHHLIPFNMQTAEQLDQDLAASTELAAAVTEETSTEERAKTIEQRNIRLRRRLRRAFERPFLELGERITRRAVDHLRKLIRQYLQVEDVQPQRFLAEVRGFFEGPYAGYVRRSSAGTFDAYARSIAAVATREINAARPAELDQEVEEYLNAFTARQAGSRSNQIAQITNQNEGEAIVPALFERLDEWTEKSPPKISVQESVQSGDFFTRAAWAAAGVSVLRWVTFGDTCPLCRQLDGRIVGIESAFVAPGDRIEGDRDTQPMQATRMIRHPPLHRGCDCSIAPGR